MNHSSLSVFMTKTPSGMEKHTGVTNKLATPLHESQDIRHPIPIFLGLCDSTPGHWKMQILMHHCSRSVLQECFTVATRRVFR